MCALALRLPAEPEVLRLESAWDGEQELKIGEKPIRFAFDPVKGKAMIKYLLREVGGTYNYMALLKLAFFADRYHVRRFGRPVSADDYYAMKLGPVPSHLFRIVQGIEGDGYNLTLSGEAVIDLDEFSRSDVEALDFAVSNFGEIGRENPFHLADLTHAYPEWDKWRTRFDVDASGREDIDFRDFLTNARPEHPVFTRFRFEDPYLPISEDQRELLIWQMEELSI